MSHKLTEPYSGKNPVPQIATKLTALVNPERATEAKAAQLQDQSEKQDHKQTEQRARRLAKGHIMHVVDPVTGDDLDIKNADEELDPSNKGENVLDTDFPPLDWKVHRAHIVSFFKPSIVYISSAYIVSFLSSRLITNFWLSTAVALVLPSYLAYALLFRIQNISQKDFDDRSWHSERIRGLRAGSDLDGNGIVDGNERVKESAEWVNAVLRGVWPIMNPDMFNFLIDTLEDIMQASVPRFIHSVRVSDIGLGSNAVRITSIRSLPDSQATKEREKKYGKRGDHNDHSGSSATGKEQVSERDEKKELDEQHVNLEVSFAYRGLPSGESAQSKARNVHLLVEFFLGIRGWYGFKVPVWVEVTGVVGSARTRLQLISDPPFIKNTLVTLLGLPRITISVVPMNRLLPNVMNLPFISGFVSSSMNTAVAEYVAPKSLTIDLQKLIRGDDIKKDTEAIGVLVIHIHRARGVKKADTTGSSDSYLTLTYSKLGRPLYSTRVIKSDCNPIFEETAVVLVDANTVRLHEKLSFQLWDADRMSVDDLLGTAEADIVDLVRNHGQPHRRSEHLSHPHRKNNPGIFEYTAGYYSKIPPTASLRSTGNDPGIPTDFQDKPEFKQAREDAMNDLESAVLVTPPDPQWPSGILCIQVHEIRGLGVKMEGRDRDMFTSVQSREGEKGQDLEDGEQEEGEGLPSSYCIISLNDELVYQTRVKPITSSPIFNAGTEQFLRDWRTAHVAVTVKDSRMRENDAILGVVMLQLSELLINASQITRLYSLEQGIGFGRIRISLLFRPVEAKLPRHLLGFDTGTLEVHDLSVQSNGEMELNLRKCEVRLKTTKSAAGEKVSRKMAQQRDDGSVEWAEYSDVKGIPVRERYSSALLVSFRDMSSMGLKHTARRALAMLWLRDIVDNDQQTVEVPLWHVTDGDYSRIKMNYSPPDGNLGMWGQDQKELKRVGSVFIHLAFRPGISEAHRDMMKVRGAKKREAWEAFTREREGELRNSIGEMDANKSGRDSDGTQAGADELETKRRGSSPHPDPATSMHTEAGQPSQIRRQECRETGQDTHEESSNTMVSSQAVETVPLNRHASSVGDLKDESAGEGSGASDGEGEGEGDKRPGPINKFRHWRQHEKELHREHKGIMQLKPARTAEWIKDNIEEGLHDAKDRFTMKSQKPDVETEV